MKKIYILITILTLSSCKSFIVNVLYQKQGLYDDSCKLYSLTKKDTSIVFLPMHHVGTELFYSDVKSKIDSLHKKNYIIYFELLKYPKRKDSLLLYKFRKAFNLPLSSKAGSSYLKHIDSVLKIKTRKKLIEQPNKESLGITSQDINADIYFDDLISAYESKFGKITLEPCDFETRFFEASTCKYNVENSKKNTILIDYRNEYVIKEISKNKHPKIAIVYGTNHYEGIKKQLIKQGFSLQ